MRRCRFVFVNDSDNCRVAERPLPRASIMLVEKPGARRAADLEPLRAAPTAVARSFGGFNHRYHRAFRKARELFDSGALGDLMFVRARYGHGAGRLK